MAEVTKRYVSWAAGSYAEGIDSTEERRSVLAFPIKKELPPLRTGQAAGAKKKPAEKKRARQPPADLKRRVDALPLPEGTLFDDDDNFLLVDRDWRAFFDRIKPRLSGATP